MTLPLDRRSISRSLYLLAFYSSGEVRTYFTVKSVSNDNISTENETVLGGMIVLLSSFGADIAAVGARAVL